MSPILSIISLSLSIISYLHSTGRIGKKDQARVESITQKITDINLLISDETGDLDIPALQVALQALAESVKSTTLLSQQMRDEFSARVEALLSSTLDEGEIQLRQLKDDMLAMTSRLHTELTLFAQSAIESSNNETSATIADFRNRLTSIDATIKAQDILIQSHNDVNSKFAQQFTDIEKAYLAADKTIRDTVAAVSSRVTVLESCPKVRVNASSVNPGEILMYTVECTSTKTFAGTYVGFYLLNDGTLKVINSAAGALVFTAASTVSTSSTSTTTTTSKKPFFALLYRKS